MRGPFRDADRIRTERVSELRNAIDAATHELALLDDEVRNLAEMQNRQLSPTQAPVGPVPHGLGILVGVVFGLPVVFLVCFLLIWALALTH